jgi:hypothetical protein
MGTRFLLIVAGSNVNDTITPTCVGSEAAMPFCSSILKMSSTEYGTKFQAYAHLKDDALIEGDFATKRGALVRLLKDDLRKFAAKYSIFNEINVTCRCRRQEEAPH